MRWQQQPNHHVLRWMDDTYPALLKEIVGAPPLLFIEGDISYLSLPQIAIVGSRNPTHTGLETAQEFGYQLAKAGLIITSGMALGIDAASHQGALAADGKTIAVLGSGLSNIYPKRHYKLAEKIAEQGCLVSEHLPSVPPLPEHFPRRNRIISGLSLGVIVVEAALRSGSLVTARYALEQNREVFAVPGSIRNPTASGCLALIKQGAKCVVTLTDVVNELPLNIQLTKKKSSKSLNCTLDPMAQQVLACIENTPTSVDQICMRSKLSPRCVNSALLQLELEGVVKTQYGYYST